jgi:hypothetical protein
MTLQVARDGGSGGGGVGKAPACPADNEPRAEDTECSHSIAHRQRCH